MAIKFDATLNLGHVVAAGVAVGSVFLAYTSIDAKATKAEAATLTFAKDHDTVIADSTRLDALTTAIIAQTTTNAAIMRALASIQQDVASIKATLAAGGRP